MKTLPDDPRIHSLDRTERRRPTAIIRDYMDICNVHIDLHYFNDQPIELSEGIVTTQSESGYKQENKRTLGTYTSSGQNH
ncbi:MAG TPA: hypothetical protein VFO54_10805 [Chryseosolibacter sp.]|nr:hypothetical protein [Chryseosolibacter sp.]